jgi:uncharacterized protein (DUF302 family)
VSNVAYRSRKRRPRENGSGVLDLMKGIAIDLPMKILIAEAPDGKVWVSYNDPAYIQARHHLSEELFRSYSSAGIDRLAAKAAE